MTAVEDVELLDAHHHLWDPRERTYPFLEGDGLELLHRRFDVDDLRSATAGTGVSRTVVVQAVGTEEETRALLGAASSSGGLVAGVVGWVDLLSQDVGARLDALRAGPGGELLVGVRHQVEEEEREWLRRPAVARGVTAVARAGLAYDLLVRPDQLPSAAALADAVPDARLLLDHGAKPPVGSPTWACWAEDVAELARRPQVVGKLSGLLTQVPADAEPGSLQPSVDHLLAAFGPERLVAGTDWPVSALAAPYAEVVARTRGWVAGLTGDEQRAVLGGSACRTYALARPDGARTDPHDHR
ncbi:amidohydrolase [uncultured Pseudokineococcus sp.]|uniref:amidohydrolase family protein n=1 Tax=uncultured Pseudokineococcus sp. TaxID=1642928 RepID=UPI002602E416|nr:amidohydrolase family protein [uncultured Pseudokineococcus sp.]